MITKVTHMTLLVQDQDEALDWYTEKLGFEIKADVPFPDNSARWLTITPPGQTELEIVLQPPDWGLVGDPQTRQQMVGQTPGWVIASENCRQDYETLKAKGVEFISPPEETPWGISAIFKDLYGTHHNLVEPVASSSTSQDR